MMTQKIAATPLGNKVIVRLDPVEKKTDSGIIIHTEGSEEREYAAQTRGTLIAVGPEAWHDIETGEPLSWKVEEGSRVMFAAYAGVRITAEKYSDRIMQDHDVIAVLEEENV